jgi:hypothetical protein
MNGVALFLPQAMRAARLRRDGVQAHRRVAAAPEPGDLKPRAACHFCVLRGEGHPHLPRRNMQARNDAALAVASSFSCPTD